MRDPSFPDHPISERLRRVLSPTYGARVNAARSMEEMADTQGIVLHSADLALFSGHPAGLSQRRAQSRMGTALWEVFPGHVALLDRDGVVISVNSAWRRFGLDHGATPPTGLGSNYLAVCDTAAADGEPEAAQAAELLRLALAGVESDARVRYLCGDRWFSMQAFPIPGLHAGALVVHTDVTTDAAALQRWRHQALHDPLTGLPNRLLLEDRLAHAVEAGARDARSVAVLFLDLDGFKQVNDRYGHGAGDEVLQEAARRLAASVRSGDTLGRWGGDEFLVIAERLTGPEMACDLAARLRASLDEPIAVLNRQVRVGVSVGIAHPQPDRPTEELIAAADRALQDVRRGRHRQPDKKAN